MNYGNVITESLISSQTNEAHRRTLRSIIATSVKKVKGLNSNVLWTFDVVIIEKNINAKPTDINKTEVINGIRAFI